MNSEIIQASETVIKTVCSTCYCSCGVLAHVKDGKVVQIEGDPNHPWNKGSLCPKGLSGIELLYHPKRLNHPLKRIGKRGEGKWQRITWEEALGLIGSRLNDIKANDGPESISLGTGAGLYSNGGMLGYFAYLLGTPNLMSTGYICFNPAAVAAFTTIGYQFALHAQEMINDEIFNTKCMLLWASNPKNSHPYPVGEGIFQCKKNGMKLIVVDPRPTEYTKIADLWLRIRPSTDDALALGMIHVIINEELYDKSFIDKFTYGFEALKRHVQQYSPRKVSGITELPEQDIVAAARLFARTKPSLVCQRLPLDQNSNPIQTSRAILIFNSLCGNLDMKGGNSLPYKGSILTENAVRAQLQKLPRQVLEKRIGAKEIPFLSGPDAPAGIIHPALWAKAVLTGEPYPIKAHIISANNQILRDQNSRTAVEALKKIEFSVTIDLFMTPTAELSDIVLPAVSWLEREGLRGHPAYPYLIPIQHRAVEPLYDRWDDNQFFIELAKKMGLKIPWQTCEEYADFRLAGHEVKFRELEAINYISFPRSYDRHKNDRFEFLTPTRKLELYSTTLEKSGHDPLPHHVEPPRTTREFPLVLMGGGNSMEFINSAGRQIDSLRQKLPDPQIEINPKTASEMGITEGDWTWLETIYLGDKERVKFKAKLVEGLSEGVVVADPGWWFPEAEDPEHGCFDSNINLVIPNDIYEPIYGSINLRSIPCRIYKVSASDSGS